MEPRWSPVENCFAHICVHIYSHVQPSAGRLGIVLMKKVRIPQTCTVKSNIFLTFLWLFSIFTNNRWLLFQFGLQHRWNVLQIKFPEVISSAVCPLEKLKQLSVKMYRCSVALGWKCALWKCELWKVTTGIYLDCVFLLNTIKDKFEESRRTSKMPNK